ncbi:hypothetical protein, partial [Sphingomonas solaris]|uniref:hypothetical protein n=1 Tax=Alterirhizorhabdus solaris TaxID=2529389 RepID=UPI001939FF6C
MDEDEGTVSRPGVDDVGCEVAATPGSTGRVTEDAARAPTAADVGRAPFSVGAAGTSGPPFDTVDSAAGDVAAGDATAATSSDQPSRVQPPVAGEA